MPIKYAKRYKRPLDITVLIVAHLFPLLIPVWLLLWAIIPFLIWLEDRGPIFYRQRRIGKDGRIFTVLKFRTMAPDAERTTGPVWASEDDPRITRIGSLLRSTAMDELPQVINIFRGEMSFVGPRPERPEIHKEFVKQLPAFQKRLQVRPGLTGLAQVNGAYNLLPGEKLKYDLDYISRMSLWLDIKLMLLSACNTLLTRWDRCSGAGRSG